MKKSTLFLTFILTTSTLLIGCKNSTSPTSYNDFSKAVSEVQKEESGYKKVTVKHSFNVGNGSKNYSTLFDIIDEKDSSLSFNSGDEKLKNLCADYSFTNSLGSLTPKYFPIGTGVFDGSYSGSAPIVNANMDVDNESFFRSLLSYEMNEKDSQFPNSNYGTKGFIKITCFSDKMEQMYIQSGKEMTFNAKDDISVKISFGTIEGLTEGQLIKDFDFYLIDKNDYPKIQLNESPIRISSSNKEVEINISEALEGWGYSSLKNVRLRISSTPNNINDYFLLKSVVFSYNETTISSTDKENFDNVSFFDRTNDEYFVAATQGIRLADASYVSCLSKYDNLGKTNNHYWASNGNREPYSPKTLFLDFTVDNYEIAYGKRNFLIGRDDLQEYVNNGWCHFRGVDPLKPLEDYSTFNVEDFVVDNEKCPITNIISYVRAQFDGKEFIQFNCIVIYYRFLGYDEMPVFLYPGKLLKPSINLGFIDKYANEFYIEKNKYRMVLQENVDKKTYAKAEIVLNEKGLISSVTARGKSNGKSISSIYSFEYE